MKTRKALPGELTVLRRFRQRVLEAFARGDLSCNCMGVTHGMNCPLGPLEIEAEELRNEQPCRSSARLHGRAI